MKPECYHQKLNAQIAKRCKILDLRKKKISHFPAFKLNTGKYGASLRIQSECEKMRTRITPNTNTFHAVSLKYAWN